MNERDRITELLRNYRSYKYAVRMFENTGWAALSGTGYSDTRSSNGFGPRAPVKFTADSVQDVMDYNKYRRAVEAVEGALEALTDEEQSVIKLKWMDDVSLVQIAKRKNYSLITIKRTHKTAFNKLVVALRFAETPEIEKIPVA